jgi:hypothetical protein
VLKKLRTKRSLKSNRHARESGYPVKGWMIWIPACRGNDILGVAAVVLSRGFFSSNP